MKKLNEMKIAREAILSEVESSHVGGMKLGTGTTYQGPSNPSSITTLVDGIPEPSPDHIQGGLYGDTWDLSPEVYMDERGSNEASIEVNKD